MLISCVNLVLGAKLGHDVKLAKSKDVQSITVTLMTIKLLLHPVEEVIF